MNIQSIQNLLQHVGIIRKKYDDFAEITGENFNVFDILNVNSDELSHSLFISYLLDAKGKHGQQDLFLKLFINQLKDRFQIEKNDVLIHFNTKKSQSKTEKSIGYKTEDVSNGGRIDIIINDGTNNIIIENKIYAGDQEKQLVRYFNYDPKAPLIYLTLGDENPSEDSIKHTDKSLEIDKDFISISYKEDIKTWIDECIKAVYDKPLIRETLRQYVYLINELTNQSNNKKMSEELVNIVLNDKLNIENYIALHQNYEAIKHKMIIEILNKIQNVLSDLFISEENFKIDTVLNPEKQVRGTLISFSKKSILGTKIFTLFFEKKTYHSLVFRFKNVDINGNLINDCKTELPSEFNHWNLTKMKEFYSQKDFDDKFKPLILELINSNLN